MSVSQIKTTANKELIELANHNSHLADLYDIQFSTPPSDGRLPDANKENTYDIDLTTRTIQAPEFLSVEKDHKATVIYFKVDRYFDYMDLANTICLVEYLPPTLDKKRVPYMYVVPIFDTNSYVLDDKIVFPWVLGNPATQEDGIIEYAIRFFRLSDETAEPKIVYDLRTLPAQSKILKGLQVNTEEMTKEYDNFTASQFEDLINQLINTRTYWDVLEA